MKTESKPELHTELSDTKAYVPLDATPSPSEDFPFYIVPAPPIPGQTSWSIVPW